MARCPSMTLGPNACYQTQRFPNAFCTIMLFLGSSFMCSLRRQALPVCRVELREYFFLTGDCGCQSYAGLWRVKAVPTLSFLRALNFFRHSTVSCLCIMEATVERCCRGEAHHMLLRSSLCEKAVVWVDEHCMCGYVYVLDGRLRGCDFG